MSELSSTETSIAEVEASMTGTAAEVVEAQRTERPMSLLAYPATYLLIGINLVMFAVMYSFGPLPALMAHHQWSSVLTAPFDADVIRNFGGTDASLVAGGAWWRLVTGTFIHVTVLHIALNMWCLWNLGLFGEPLLGKQGLISVYLLTGTSGMMLSYINSLFFNHGEGLVVGASGAVFGIAGILIVLLSNRRLSLPWNELRGLRRQVIFFAAANLAIGMAPHMLGMVSNEQLARVHLDPESLPRIDNTAHLGGFLAGLALGLPLFPRMTSGRSSYRQRQRVTFAVAALVLCLVMYALAKTNS